MDLNTLLSEFIDSLDKEILKKKEKAANKPVILKEGYMSSEMPSGMIYRFEEFTGSAMPDSPAEIEILDIGANSGDKFNALVVGVENEVLSLYIYAKSLPDLIEKARLIIDNVKLLENTRDSAKSKNKKQNNSSDEHIKKPEYISKELVPVLMLKKNDKDGEGKDGGGRSAASNSGANIIRSGSKIGNKRKYFYSLSALAKYMRDNYQQLQDLEIVDGKVTKRLFEVVEKAENLMSENFDSLKNEWIIVFGVVEDVTNHLAGHKSLWFGDKFDLKTPRIFINTSLLDDKNKTQDYRKKEVLVYGRFEKINDKYSPQITIESLKDLQLIV